MFGLHVELSGSGPSGETAQSRLRRHDELSNRGLGRLRAPLTSIRSDWNRYFNFGLFLVVAHAAASAHENIFPAASSPPRIAQVRRALKTVPDSVILDANLRMWRIEEGARATAAPLAQFSPDGHAFSAVLWRGDLRRNVTEWQLRLFATATFEQGGAVGEKLLTVPTHGNSPAISRVTWLANGRTLAFLGSFNDAPRQVYTLELSSRRLTRRTSSATPVIFYDISPDGSGIAYYANASVDTAAQEAVRQRGFVVPWNKSLTEADLEPDYASGEVNPGRDVRVFFQRRGESRAREVVRLRDWNLTNRGSIRLSPDHQFIVLGHYEAHAEPAKWSAFDAPMVREMRRFNQVWSTILIGVRTGHLSRAIDAPAAIDNNAPLWNPTGRTFVVNGYLPITSADTTAIQLAHGEGALIEIDPRTRRATLVRGGPCTVLRWTSDGDTLWVTRDLLGGTSLPVLKLERVTHGWLQRDSVLVSNLVLHPYNGRASDGKWIVGIRQTATLPPELAAIEVRSGRSMTLTDLNPELRKIPFGRVDSLTLRSVTGASWPAKLVLPVDYVPSRRYPAIIMKADGSTIIDGYLLDHPFFNGRHYPIQAFANRGFVVLMLYNSPEGRQWGATPRECPETVAGADAAFEHLVATGIADSARIGIMGISHAGYETECVIAYSPHRYGAAMAIDHFEASYLEFLMCLPFCESMQRYYGGIPWTDSSSFDAWRRLAPAFNSARVRTPLLLEYHGQKAMGRAGRHFVGGAELFSGLRQLRKPVELVGYPYGMHWLRKPLEAWTSEVRELDWFDFWLTGREDPAREKREQYDRWRSLRDLSSSTGKQ